MGTAEQLCDRVVFIVAGKVPLIDSPRDFKLRHGSRTLRVEYDGTADSGTRQGAEFDLDTLAEAAEFQRLLREERIQTMHTQEASLADVFIDVTGHSLA